MSASCPTRWSRRRPDPDRACLRARLPDVLWNIGAEGHLLGAWGASLVVLAPILPEGTPGIVVIPAMMLAGTLAGAAWGFIPGLLRARLGVNEIITTLMLNYVALAWIQFWVFGPWSEGGFQQTETFPREAWLPPAHRLRRAISVLSGLTTHLGLVFADRDRDRLGGRVADALGLRDAAHRRQRAGRAIRGRGHRALHHRGVHRVGCARARRDERSGRLGPSTTGPARQATDLTAIIIAYLAHLGPWRVVVASILFGALILAGREIQPSAGPGDDPGDHPLRLIIADAFVRYRVVVTRRATAAA